MSGTVFTIAQQKGGAGKTTLAAQMAAFLACDGYRVGTIDVDPQGSLSLWYAARMSSIRGEDNIIHAQIQGWRIKKEVVRLRGECDFVLIDSPPHAETEAKMAIREADLVLIPMQPSPIDLWASRPTIKAAQSEKKDMRLILNRVAPRTKLNSVILEKMQELDVKPARHTLGSRVAFAHSMMNGLGVSETEPSSMAAKEIKALAQELIKLSKKSVKKAA